MPYTDLDFKNTTLGRKELSKGEKSQKLGIIFNCARNDVDAGSWVAQKRERQILVSKGQKTHQKSLALENRLFSRREEGRSLNIC